MLKLQKPEQPSILIIQLYSFTGFCFISNAFITYPCAFIKLLAILTVDHVLFQFPKKHGFIVT